jgi:hypothetical protein
MRKLNNRYMIYVPSDFNGSGYQRSWALIESEKFLAEQCGGSTTITGTGNWIGDNGLVREEVYTVFAYSDKDVADKLRAFAIEACKRWHQECVAIEHSNALWLVNKNDQPAL